MGGALAPGGTMEFYAASGSSAGSVRHRSAQLFTIALQPRQSSLQFRHHRSVEPHQSQDSASTGTAWSPRRSGGAGGGTSRLTGSSSSG